MKTKIYFSIFVFVLFTVCSLGQDITNTLGNTGTFVVRDDSDTTLMVTNDRVRVGGSNSYTLPNTDGTAAQVLATDGAGTLSWTTLSAGGSDVGGVGASMFTRYMLDNDMFTPHTNNCDVTEAFVPLFTGATVGFCMEKDERAAAYWTNAVKACLAVGRRLPEPGEWQSACYQAGILNLNNMTGNWEWTSNFPLFLHSSSASGVASAIFGTAGCNNAVVDFLGNGNDFGGSQAFRCVH